MNKSDFKEGYKQGEMKEAVSALRNLYKIYDQITPAPHKNDYINTYIADLEHFTGKNRKYFDNEEDAFSEEF
jgi:VanZ family protein